MKKSIGLILVAALCFVSANGCKPPVVTQPDPAGFKPVEAIEAQEASASSGGGRRDAGPPSVEQSAEMLPPQ